MFSFAAMGTVVSVAAPGLRASEERALSCDVQTLLEIEEQRFSRFSERSELALLQRARGPVVVSPELFEALAAAHDHHRATGGLFDPAIGSALEALGYDRSFERGGLDREHEALRSEVAHFDELVLDPATRTVARPPHLRIDLAGLDALDLTIPFLAPVARLPTALGVLSAWMLVGLHASYAMRGRLGARTWRKLHYASFGLYGLATIHGIAAGTDVGRPWAIAIYAGSGLVIGALLLARISQSMARASVLQSR